MAEYSVKIQVVKWAFYLVDDLVEEMDDWTADRLVALMVATKVV
jgi:hypothetical protein